MEPSLDLQYIRDLDAITRTRQRVQRETSAGLLRHISRGVYAPSAEWERLSALEKHRSAAIAVGSWGTRPVISHQSAAVLHGLPLLALPSSVHVTIGTSGSRNARKGVTKHSSNLAADDVVMVDGVWVTSVARTVVDLAALLDFYEAVVVADRALLVRRFGSRIPMATRADLVAAWHRARPIRADARVRTVIGFAAIGAETPIESVSRTSLWIVGAPAPMLQSLQVDAEGEIGYSDFDWPAYEAVAEADGATKYLDEANRSGRSAEQVVLDEKDREDRVRAIPKRFTRWRWAVAVDPTRLLARIAPLRLPIGRRYRIPDPRE